ncbi:MAG: hypothetical protein KAH96_04255, partial [Alphaproteobacteria bacterium]|nr:hypothetical protein [Alphaproteobacteria bacterium]
PRLLSFLDVKNVGSLYLDSFRFKIYLEYQKTLSCRTCSGIQKAVLPSCRLNMTRGRASRPPRKAGVTS